MNPVVHFELPAENRERISKFYTQVFGWETKQWGEDMGNYVTAMTTKSTEKGPIDPGAINGGFYQKTDDMPEQHPSIVISVEDVEEHMKEIKNAGGRVLGEPIDIPGAGKYVSFIDTEGNRLSILEPLEME